MKSGAVAVIGRANAGKSTLINVLVGEKISIVSPKPQTTRDTVLGVMTREDYQIVFMDTPGMLWPKIEDDAIGYKLAFRGTIRDEILDIEDLACKLLEVLRESYTENVVKRYGITGISDELTYDTLEEMAQKRGFLAGRCMLDTERMAKVFIDEFRSGKLGRMTLEMPPKA